MRRANKPKNETKNGEDFMDQDDQEKLVAQLEHQAMEQQRQTQSYFSLFCKLAIILTLLLAIFIDRRSPPTLQGYRWGHGFLSAGMHWLCSGKQPFIPWTFQKLFMLCTISFAAVACMTTRMRLSDPDDCLFFHQALGCLNLLVIGVRFLLQHDQASTQKSLNELKKSTYRYKSL